MKSSYQLVPILVTPSINPGDKIEIKIFFTGEGSLSQNKLTFYPPDDLLDDGNIGKYFWAFPLKIEDKIYEPDEGIPLEHKVGWISVPKKFFEPYRKANNNELSWNYGETLVNTRPPFILSLNTSDKVRAGDYTINFVLTYSNGDEIAGDHKSITIHVKTWAERNSKALQMIGALAGGLAIITGALFFL